MEILSGSISALGISEGIGNDIVYKGFCDSGVGVFTDHGEKKL